MPQISLNLPVRNIKVLIYYVNNNFLEFSTQAAFNLKKKNNLIFFFFDKFCSNLYVNVLVTFLNVIKKKKNTECIILVAPLKLSFYTVCLPCVKLCFCFYPSTVLWPLQCGLNKNTHNCVLNFSDATITKVTFLQVYKVFDIMQAYCCYCCVKTELILWYLSNSINIK